LFTSGYSEATGLNAAQLSNSHYLQKPYSPTSLARVIRQILDRDSHQEMAQIENCE
jgi:DNA-binding response OmpR family regulator